MPFTENDYVRLKADPHKVGIVVGMIERGPRVFVKVRLPDGIKQWPLNHTELCPPVAEEPLDLLRDGKFSAPGKLRQTLAHIRLTGQLADTVYSMEATNTDFHAHQFKPVLKILDSPTGNLLIADEVGLGKTIEAGLIWTELKARYDYGRLLVICPKVLVPKWEAELSEKFMIDARAMTAGELLSALEERGGGPGGFTAVCGMQGLRPPRGWDDPAADDFERHSARLARLLDDRAAAPDEPLFDLVIVDEAHHLRNAGTQTNKLAQLLQPVTKHLLFLSATPINLRDDDLFALLNLIDPQTYSDISVLREIMEANEPLIRARDRILAGATQEELLGLLLDARRRPLLRASRQLAFLLEDLGFDEEAIPKERRVEIAARLERINLFANTINRTRRRDVEEFRVGREPKVVRAKMSPEERLLYDAFTQAIHEFSLSRVVNAGFLSATPQRMLASCLPAAVEHWRSGGEVAEDEIEHDDVEASENPRPLLSAIRPVALRAPGLKDLERMDAKYARLLRWLREVLAENSEEKLILFSTFRPTIAYLARRLREDGVANLSIVGGDKNRTEIIEQFRVGTTPVLLASEVGSEGIDLQFARTVVNYDMPWNPMKVEQRIGRVDRLGQEAEKIHVVNFLIDGTIDQRIYDKLYDRLGLCERALGGFEEIIGQEISRLAPELLSGSLSDAEIEARLEQAAQSLAERRRQEIELEREAAALVHHGDHILRSIHDAREMNRWISHRDLARYIDEALSSLHPGCDLIELEEDGLYDLQLTVEARGAIADFCERRRLPRDRVLTSEGRVRCRLGRPGGRASRRRKAVETVTQTHPLLRYLSSRFAEAEGLGLRPAIAARVPVGSVSRDGIEPGRYLIASQYWRFGGKLSQERIAYAGMSLSSGREIPDDDSEALMRVAATDGQLWPNADLAVDCFEVADLAETVLLSALDARNGDASDAIEALKADRANIQLETLERRVREQIERKQQTIESQLERVDAGADGSGKLRGIITANRGQIEKLRDRAQMRRMQIEASVRHSNEMQQLAVALIEVHP